MLCLYTSHKNDSTGNWDERVLQYECPVGSTLIRVKWKRAQRYSSQESVTDGEPTLDSNICSVTALCCNLFNFLKSPFNCSLLNFLNFFFQSLHLSMSIHHSYWTYSYQVIPLLVWQLTWNSCSDDQYNPAITHPRQTQQPVSSNCPAARPS